MQLFSFDRAKAAKSIADPDGALWPVNAYSDADELNALLEAAQACAAIARSRPRARVYVYPLSICEPEPLLAACPGAGPTLLGHSLKLREREDEGETPLEFTLRLLEELTAEANGLAADRAAPRPRAGAGESENWNLRCPECCSEEAAPVVRGTRLECGNCGARFLREEALVAVGEAEDDIAAAADPTEPKSLTRRGLRAEDPRTTWPAEVRVDRPEQLDELVRLAAGAEIGLTIFDDAPCTCDDVRGCPQCFDRAEALVGATVRDSQGRVWQVTDVDEKDGFPTICGERYWDRPDEVEVLRKAI